MKTIPSLTDKVAVVTGASRGVGADIATLLGEQGATVYVTGRTTASKPGTTPGTISEVADSITRAGGVGIAVVCDHADDAQMASWTANLGLKQRTSEGRARGSGAVRTLHLQVLTRYGDYFSAELRLVQAQLNERLGASAAFCEH